jgi:hypothetical protein
MSYVIHIWQTPIPTSVLQAERICDRLQDKEAPQNPKFIELAKRLAVRYPCRSQMTYDEDEYEDDREGVWIDDVMDGISPNPVLTLGIRIQYKNVIEVMPFVAETANALGLTVYDGEIGECYLPGGKVLTMPGQELVGFDAAADPGRLDSGAHITRIAVDHSTEFFNRYGYRVSHGGNCFVKNHDGFYHAVRLFGGGRVVSASHAIGLTKGLHLVSHIAQVPYLNSTPKPESAWEIDLYCAQDDTPKLWPEVDKLYPAGLGGIEVISVPEVKSAMDKIMAYEQKTLMSLVSNIQTLGQLHEFLSNPAFWFLLNSRFENYFGQLLTAYLAGVDNFDALIVEIRTSFSANCGDFTVLELFDKTVELIRLEQRTASA